MSLGVILLGEFMNLELTMILGVFFPGVIPLGEIILLGICMPSKYRIWGDHGVYLVHK